MTKQHTTDELELIKQFIFDYNMDTTVLGKNETKALDAAANNILAWHAQQLKNFYERIKPEKREVMENIEHLTNEMIVGRQYYNAAIRELEANASKEGL